MVTRFLLSASILSIAALLGYWTQDRDDPTRILVMHAVNDPVAPGDILKVAYEIQRDRGCHVHVEQLAFDRERLRMQAPDEDYTAAPGPDGSDKFTLQMPISTAAVEGPGTYYAVRAYYCNPLQTWLNWPIIVRTPPLTFTIGRS